ncbi:Dihydroorotate dehydrogenase, catalytic subunit [Desulfurella amilsii]|uniref:Dihydroorotate dehydrogenase n=1 Tax=Desulfurella amilsii TaxID=1562698 RepID=A0A1X4XZ64_9BACT|nr:dihydroorotate dehydrogenase [Desulfurella amilsii]OSS42749.1 Dihydroorotate dehydrogenase, catalytic subunit [Desulfurella amilsii]OSS42825.1 Dihydroorotate dehydrogenase, catalytic subunit [Desulfurella amilsii]
MVNLEVKLSNLRFKNPVLVASGTFGWGIEYNRFFDIGLLGGVIVKGLSLNPRQGNPPPRIVETPCGMLNSIGLQNIGLEKFVSEVLPQFDSIRTNLIVNIYGSEIGEFVELAGRLNNYKQIAALEINVSCPNVKAGGAAFGKDPEVVFVLISSIKKVCDKTIIVKLTPNVTDIALIAQAAQSAKADAVSLINTLTGMIIDTKTKKPFLGNKFGGLSGPAIYPVGLKMVYETYEKVNIPIIGVGGIYNADVAVQYILAGASMIQIGTANFVEPDISLKIIEGIRRYLEDEEIDDVNKLVGLAHN